MLFTLDVPTCKKYKCNTKVGINRQKYNNIYLNYVQTKGQAHFVLSMYIFIETEKWFRIQM